VLQKKETRFFLKDFFAFSFARSRTMSQDEQHEQQQQQQQQQHEQQDRLFLKKENIKRVLTDRAST